MKEKDRQLIEKYVKLLRWTPKDYYWKHSFRVREFALMIQEKVGGDKDVLETAALLHDIGKAKLLAPGHEELSAQIAKDFLKKIDFDEGSIQLVTKCIEYEDFKMLEARILRSADSMSLLADASGGREWYFKKILNGDKNKIMEEIKRSYSEIDFDFAKNIVKENYMELLELYS